MQPLVTRTIFYLLVPMTILLPLTFPKANAAEERGQAIFGLCAKCHGTGAQGNIKLLAPAIAGMPEWYIDAQVKKFKNGGRGKHFDDIAGMRMRPMARTIQTDEDIALVSKYISKLPTALAAPVLRGDPVLGKTSYGACVACHGSKAEGNKAMGAPPLTTTNDWYLAAQIRNFKSGTRGYNPVLDPGGAQMAPMAMTLFDESTVNNVISYIQSLR
jgi:cytochrome c553